MCCNQKCCFCIPVDVGSLILGVFSSIINAFGILGCIGGLVYVNEFLYQEQFRGCVGSYCASISYDSEILIDNREKYALMAGNAGLSVGLVLFLIDFAFSVALADGASKKLAGHIKAYFVYGVVKLVMFVIADIILFVLLLPLGIILVIPIVIYGLLLVMVFKTHTKFTRGSVYGGMILKNEDDQVQLV